MGNVFSKTLSRLGRSAASGWVKGEADFTLAKALEPVISNRGLIAILVPLPFITLLNRVLATQANLNLLFMLLCVWYFAAFLTCAGLAVRWYLRSAGIRALAEEAETTRDRLARALANTHRHNKDYFEISSWEEAIKVDKLGTATVTRSVTIRAGDPMDVFWSDLESYGPLVPPDQVSLTVRQRLANGGTRELPFDPIWKQTSFPSLVSSVYIWFPEVVTKGEEVQLIVSWKWPKFYDRLMNAGQSEHMNYAFTRNCRELSIHLDLPARKDRELVVANQAGCKSSVSRTHKFERVVLEAKEIGRGDHVVATIVSSRVDTKKGPN